ncbi:MAG: pseudouridine synthase [Candidatus Aenigmatarchaeota archaeon]
MEERIQKLIAKAGICSRRKAEELIKKGAVKVNGRAAKLGDKADPKTDKIAVNRIPLRPWKKRYFLLYKPKGYITTMNEQFQRPCVDDLLREAEIKERLFPVGRLDMDSEGLLILTNDGELANLIAHPRFEVEKTYEVALNKPLKERDLERMEAGVMIDGRRATPNSVRILGRPEKIRITLHEGRNRIVRRMMEKLGYRVMGLKRTAIGGLSLIRMRESELKEVTKEEIEKGIRA